MKVALVQTDIVWENKEANYDAVRSLLAEYLFEADNTLVVLPELFATGFTMNASQVEEPDMGPTETFLCELAEEKKAYVIGGVAKTNDSGGHPFNCSILVSPGSEILWRYRKTHPFSLGEEDQNYSKGSKAEIQMIEGVSVAPAICYDLRFPELFRLTSEKGAEVYVVIANWPARRNQHWITLLQARAIENQAYVIGVNRCGEDPGLTYAGSSIVVDYMGEIIADAGSNACVTIAELDIEALREWRSGFPALRDRHPQLTA